MQRKESHLLKVCKGLIEEKLNWAPSRDWKQRDYVNLLSLIEEESGITISLSTIKRIWKTDYRGRPQPATLDALARFLGYESWLAFTSSHPPSKAVSPEVQAVSPKLSNKAYFFISLAVMALLLLCFLLLKEDTRPVFKGAKLAVKNSSPLNVPNTVIFSYDLEGIEADSFFIQQSWNRFQRERIRKEDSILTSTYYYPGAHKASLIANEQVVAERRLNIKTEDWIAVSRLGMADQDPLYLKPDTSNSSGKLQVSQEELLKYRTQQNPNLMLSYYYVNEFEGLDKKNFRLKLGLKNDSLPTSACPMISIMILGSEDMHFIPFSKAGCIGKLSLKIGEKLIQGKHADLSAFGTDIFDWHSLELRRQDSDYEIGLDEELIYRVKVEGEIGEIIGINVNFSGSGKIDFVEVGDSRTQDIWYRKDF